jgi:uncharacterized protein YecE (DUF72 family)
MSLEPAAAAAARGSARRYTASMARKRRIPEFRIGIAGWSIPKQHAPHFPVDGSHLERYAARFSAAEINSSFYRPHRPRTYARWAATVPDEFRFAVKVPREITHRRRLVEVDDLLEPFLAEATQLGDKLGPLLVQLPPSFAFDASVGGFFKLLRRHFAGNVICEPRHATWFSDEAERLLMKFRVARVAADPAVVPAAAEPGGWKGLAYFRLHGAPKIYYSAYSAETMAHVLDRMTALAPAGPVWCIFDNTALGEAYANALQLLAKLSIQLQRPV